jgi:hypothetical protein
LTQIPMRRYGPRVTNDWLPEPDVRLHGVRRRSPDAGTARGRSSERPGPAGSRGASSHPAAPLPRCGHALPGSVGRLTPMMITWRMPVLVGGGAKVAVPSALDPVAVARPQLLLPGGPEEEAGMPNPVYLEPQAKAVVDATANPPYLFEPCGLGPRTAAQGVAGRQLPVPALGLCHGGAPHRAVRRPRRGHRAGRRVLHATRACSRGGGGNAARDVQPAR